MQGRDHEEPEERAGLFLPAIQQGEQLNFAALPSGSPVDFRLLDCFCHTPFPHPMPALAMDTPRDLYPAHGVFGPSLPALCQR